LLNLLLKRGLKNKLYLYMKLFTHIFVLFLLVGCKAKTTELITEQREFITTTNCPEDGECKVELFPNSSLEILADKFNNTYTNTNKGDKIIFKFTFSRNRDKMAVDGHYIEEIYAEFDKNLPDLTLVDGELKNVKLLYNKMCYCKGVAGYYQIEKGTLKFKKADKKTYNIQLDFKLDTIYQVITSINETLILD
jgi:hypothetical protein